MKNEKEQPSPQENNCEKGERRIKDLIDKAKKKNKIFSAPKR
jgi:hypothetical protein